MIDGFEQETKPLTEEEMNLLPIIIRGLRTKVGADSAIFGAEICKKMTAAGYKLTEPRLRKIVNHIRSNGMLPVIATSKGYYTSYDASEIQSQIESLEQRKAAIDHAIQGLKKFI